MRDVPEPSRRNLWIHCFANESSGNCAVTRKIGVAALAIIVRATVSQISPARNPIVAELDVGPLHGGPGNAMGRLFLPAFAGMRGPGVVERLAINVLRMVGQMIAHRRRQIVIDSIRHG